MSNYGRRRPSDRTDLSREIFPMTYGPSNVFYKTTMLYNWQNVETCGLETQRMVHGFLVSLVTQPLILVYSLLVCVICYLQPSLVFFIDDIIHCAELSTTDVGNRFFVVSTSLTQATPNSKKRLKRKGEEKKDKEKRKVQSKPKVKRVDFRVRDSLERPHHNSVSDLDLVIATSGMSQFGGFTRPGHLESNPMNTFWFVFKISLSEYYGCAWKEKTGQEGQYLQVTSSSSSDKNKK
ncbi:hypothetical protein K435DRAFT_840025 [Dendrothele bispora CBS 962.96]|uniref:Uncharacterized protein n=1 Tax=Dendrothele bispora (strain CBS 962.96) TaxID=1314807 RepID=A0A4S8LXP5_DENBC|nr:hypothetical protein K435DRAFT_840025 [Dendrothele bispora CBS 962.96]